MSEQATNPPGRKLRVALIGCGLIGKLHAERLASDERVALSVFCDPVESAARALRDRIAPAAAIETTELHTIDRYPLDAVVLCTPTQQHYSQACRALDAGLHVLCEKPLASARREIIDLVDRHRRLGLILSVAYQRRYEAPYTTARRELTERADWYGPLKQIHLFVCERWQQTIAGTWRDDPLVGSGYFGDAGSHQVDASFFISGHAPEMVFAQGDKRGSNVEIVTAVLAKLTGDVGLSAHFVGDANHWREDIHFHCRDADLLIRSEKLFRCKDNQVEPITDLLPANTPDRAFIDAILSGKPTVSPPQCAVPMADWTSAVLHSLRDGAWARAGNGG